MAVNSFLMALDLLFMEANLVSKIRLKLLQLLFLLLIKILFFKGCFSLAHGTTSIPDGSTAATTLACSASRFTQTSNKPDLTHDRDL